jgi:hypothetical protein
MANIGNYLDLYQLLQHPPATHEVNRAFGLEQGGGKPLEQLNLWVQKHRARLGAERWSEVYARYAYGAGLVLGVGWVCGV